VSTDGRRRQTRATVKLPHIVYGRININVLYKRHTYTSVGHKISSSLSSDIQTAGYFISYNFRDIRRISQN